MNENLFSVILTGSSFAAGLVIYLTAVFLIRRWDKFISSRKVKIRLAHLRKPLLFLIPAFCLIIVMPFTRFEEGIYSIIARVLNLWLIASCGFLLIKAVFMAREMILSQYDVEARDNLLARRVYTQIGVISNIIIVGIILLTVSFILMTFPAVRQIGVSLLASAGVLGIVLGFAAQKTLGNIIAGIQIAISQPIRLDDAVVVENEWGWIEEITLTYVVVRIWDLRRLVLPISYFIEKPFQNWTRTSADIIGSVFLYVDYTVPIEEVRQELYNILEKSPYWDKKVKVLQVTNTTERTVELRALMSAADSPTAWNLRCEVREKLIEFLQKKYPKGLPRTRVELNKS
ncbi:MAG: mechanosensitive ion channel family protein [Candidatus Omnitrophica bacterium]|nr:mechanosensitive ion channel family protein [Candidatus Omnitrophota bacterium]